MRGPWLSYRRSKSRTICTVPLLLASPPHYCPPNAHLRACIEAAPRHMTWLSTAPRASRSPKAAGQWFSSAAKAAGIKAKTARGLRKYLATYIAEHGAT